MGDEHVKDTSLEHSINIAVPLMCSQSPNFNMGIKTFVLAILLFSFYLATAQTFLRVVGRDFYYGNDKIYLSGVNIAWNSYGYDFGNNQYNQSSGETLEQWLREIGQGGGNSIRKVLYCRKISRH